VADVNRFSEGLIDMAERFADVVESAQGKGARKGGSSGAKWLVLPAVGAAAYALATSSSGLARGTRKLVSRAKDRAADLPDADLLGRVKEVTGVAEQSESGATGQSQKTRASQNRRRRASQTPRRRKKTTSTAG
jgi:hypothetical protein